MFGLVYLRVVFVCRKRFKDHRRRVAIGATVFFTIISGIIFAYGLATIDLVWNWSFYGSFTFFQLATIAFFSWAGILVLIQAIQFLEQNQIRKHRAANDNVVSAEIEEGEEDDGGDGDDPKLFVASKHFLTDDLYSLYDGDGQQHEEQEEEEREIVTDNTPALSRSSLQEPLLCGPNEHRQSNQSSYYSSGEIFSYKAWRCQSLLIITHICFAKCS